MAIEIKNPNEDDKDKGPLNVSGQSVGGSAPETSGMGTAAAGGLPAAPNAPKSPTGNRFVNIQRYFQANQGAGQKLGGAIGGEVNKASEKVGQAVEGGNAVKSQLDAEKDRIAKASGFAQQVQQDPTKIAADPNQLNLFTQLRTGQTGLGQINQQAQQVGDAAQSQLKNLQGLAQQTGSEAGRFDLLRQTLGRPTYTRGQQKLDQLLLQGEGNNALGQLQRDAQAQALAGQRNVNDLQNVLGQRMTDTEQAARAASQQLGQVLGRMDDPTTTENEAAGQFGALQSSLQNKAKDFINTNQAAYDSLRANLDRSGGLSPAFTRDQLSMLGLNPDQQLYDVNLNEYVNPAWSSANVTPQNMANAQDLARYQALAKLSGTADDYLKPDMLKPAAGLTVDQAKLGQLQQTLKARGETVSSLQKQIDDIPNWIAGRMTQRGGFSEAAYRPIVQAEADAKLKALQDQLASYRPGRMVGTIE